MVESINLNSIRVDDKGRVSVSGLGSGIDYKAAVDSIIKARQIPVDRLSTRITESIAARGTSFRDYRDASGGRGDFERSLAVYGRGGQPCLRCGARLVETHAVDERSTVLCARCQR